MNNANDKTPNILKKIVKLYQKIEDNPKNSDKNYKKLKKLLNYERKVIIELIEIISKNDSKLKHKFQYHRSKDLYIETQEMHDITQDLHNESQKILNET